MIRQTATIAKTTPVVWDSGCLEEVCGACTMVINGRVRQSCSALIANLVQESEVLTLEPMSKFPVVRDLAVDRQRMFHNLARIKAWVPIDGTWALGRGPLETPEKAEVRYKLSTCMTCGCCLEACPQYLQNNNFVGAFAMNQVRLFNSHPTGKMNASERTHALMEPGGVQDCGKAQNCVQVCPKEIPLTSSIMAMNTQATVQMVKDLFTRDEGEEAKHGGPA